MGKTLTEALANQVRYAGRTATVPVGTITSCSEMLGRLTPPRPLGVGWWAWVSAPFAPLLPSGQPNGFRDQHQWGFACGGTTPDQALAAAYDEVKKKRNQPFATYHVFVGMTAELDHARLQAERRLGQPYSAWTMECYMPDNLDTARASFMPRDPGSGQAFAAMLLSPEMRMRQYPFRGGTVSIGCIPFFNTPEPNQPPPVL